MQMKSGTNISINATKLRKGQNQLDGLGFYIKEVPHIHIAHEMG